jgi:transposase-like protein
LLALARHCGINPKTVAKWRKRSTVADTPTGPKDTKSIVLTIDEEAIIVALKRHTLLPLDDCLYALQTQSHNCGRRLKTLKASRLVSSFSNNGQKARKI